MEADCGLRNSVGSKHEQEFRIPVKQTPHVQRGCCCGIAFRNPKSAFQEFGGGRGHRGGYARGRGSQIASLCGMSPSCIPYLASSLTRAIPRKTQKADRRSSLPPGHDAEDCGAPQVRSRQTTGLRAASRATRETPGIGRFFFQGVDEVLDERGAALESRAPWVTFQNEACPWFCHRPPSKQGTHHTGSPSGGVPHTPADQLHVVFSERRRRRIPMKTRICRPGRGPARARD